MHFIFTSEGSGNDACGFSQGQVACDNVGWQPPNVGKLFDGAEAKLALGVSVVGLTYVSCGMLSLLLLLYFLSRNPVVCLSLNPGSRRPETSEYFLAGLKDGGASILK